MRRYKGYILLLLFFLNVSIVYPQQETKEKRIEKQINLAIDSAAIPGVFVAVVKDGEVIYSKGHGVLDIDTTFRVSEQSYFPITAITKSFTAISLALLVQEGKLKWSDKVRDHYPEFKASDHSSSEHLTIRELLGGLSGWDSYQGDLLWYGTYYQREEILERARRMNPREQHAFGYSNIAYMVAAQVVENISDLPYSQFLHDRVLFPLGLKDTYSSYFDIQNKDLISKPHINSRSIRRLPLLNTEGSLNLISNGQDMQKWMLFLLNKGKMGDQILLKPKFMEELWEAVTPVRINSYDWNKHQVRFKNYTMGWFSYNFKGQRVLQQSSELPGSVTTMLLAPDANVGVIVMSNGESSVPYALCHWVLEEYLGGKHNDWVKDFLLFDRSYAQLKAQKMKERLELRKEGTTPHLPLSSYVGAFEDHYFGGANIEMKSDSLEITLLPSPRRLKGVLTHWHYNTFKVEFDDPYFPMGFVNFVMDSNGRVSKFTLEVPNGAIGYDYLEFKKKK